MAQYIKTLTTTCISDLLEAVNADGSISAECVQVIDTEDGNITFDFDGTIDAGEETALDAIISGWSCPAAQSDPSVQSYVYTDTYEPDEIKILTLPLALPNMVVHVMDPAVVENIGASLISAKGTGWDPANKSTGEANINNGVLTDLCYNNSSTGNTEGIIFGIDMGTATAVDAIKRYDYSTGYYDKHWEFIGTNNSDGSGYTVIKEVEQKSANLSTGSGPYEASFSTATFRYFGCRCSESYNATYTIVSELELYSGGSIQTVEKKLANNIDYEYSWTSDTTLSIKNIGSEDRTFKVIVMGT